jgi:hypothetical protein
MLSGSSNSRLWLFELVRRWLGAVPCRRAFRRAARRRALQYCWNLAGSCHWQCRQLCFRVLRCCSSCHQSARQRILTPLSATGSVYAFVSTVNFFNKTFGPRNVFCAAIRVSQGPFGIDGSEIVEGGGSLTIKHNKSYSGASTSVGRMLTFPGRSPGSFTFGCFSSSCLYKPNVHSHWHSHHALNPMLLEMIVPFSQ